MVSISLCMIVKNEEESLKRCLDSVQEVVDEIIIVDTGSTDTTKEIARCYTDKLYDFCWVDDFAAARNFSFSKAEMEYILWLDADDVLSSENAIKLFQLKQSLSSSIDSVTMDYLLAFDEYGNVTSSLKRNRLVKRINDFKWIGFVHEYLQVHGTIVDSDISVIHMGKKKVSNRNLMIYENLLAKDVSLPPRDLYYFANELYDHRKYERATQFYIRFLETNAGWIEDILSSCGKLADCYSFLGDYERTLQWTLKSFHYDSPRAEACCRAGFHFIRKKQWEQAIFWYKLATELEKPKNNWGLLNHACWTWLPHIQLCVCYANLEMYELAYKHNEMVRQYRPNDEYMIHNQKFLETKLKQ